MQFIDGSHREGSVITLLLAVWSLVLLSAVISVIMLLPGGLGEFFLVGRGTGCHGSRRDHLPYFSWGAFSFLCKGLNVLLMGEIQHLLGVEVERLSAIFCLLLL